MQREFRTAEHSDASLIRTLSEQAWIPTYEPILSPEQLKFMFEEWYSTAAIVQSMNEGQTFVIASADGIPAGYASYSIQDAETVKLNKIYLLPTEKGKGFGRELLSEIELRCSSLNRHTLVLNVNRYNPAVGFYKACGYSIVKEVDIPIGTFWMNDYVMLKTVG